MKLLLDAGLPYRAVVLLRTLGHDVVHAQDLGPPGLEDTSIIGIGRAQGRIVITLDADFHALLAQQNAVSPSVIRLRMQALREQECCEVIEKILRHCGEALNKGAAVSATRTSIRVHTLPLA